MIYFDDGTCPHDGCAMMPVTGPETDSEILHSAWVCPMCERAYRVTFPTMIDCEIEEIADEAIVWDIGFNEDVEIITQHG